jgi:hypothetical protein
MIPKIHFYTTILASWDIRSEKSYCKRIEYISIAYRCRSVYMKNKVVDWKIGDSLSKRLRKSPLLKWILPKLRIGLMLKASPL